jgi:hypothetical protein
MRAIEKKDQTPHPQEWFHPNYPHPASPPSPAPAGEGSGPLGPKMLLEENLAHAIFYDVRRRQNLSPHQKQIRFLTFFLGSIVVALVIGLMWLLSYNSMLSH